MFVQLESAKKLLADPVTAPHRPPRTMMFRHGYPVAAWAKW
jgi:hypothetical protein